MSDRGWTYAAVVDAADALRGAGASESGRENAA